MAKSTTTRAGSCSSSTRNPARWSSPMPPDHALPVLGQPDLLHLGKAGVSLSGTVCVSGPVVLGRGALEGRLDQRPTLQGQELVVGLTEGDLADVLDAVASTSAPSNWNTTRS